MPLVVVAMGGRVACRPSHRGRGQPNRLRIGGNDACCLGEKSTRSMDKAQALRALITRETYVTACNAHERARARGLRKDAKTDSRSDRDAAERLHVVGGQAERVEAEVLRARSHTDSSHVPPEAAWAVQGLLALASHSFRSRRFEVSGKSPGCQGRSQWCLRRRSCRLQIHENEIEIADS